MNPLSYLPLDKMRCFEVFNAAARRPAKGEPLHAIGSDGYKANAAATYAIGMEYRERAQKLSARFQQPMYGSNGALLDRGLTQICCHEDDAVLVREILDGMQADGHLAQVAELPFKQSQLYALAKAKYTPH